MAVISARTPRESGPPGTGDRSPVGAALAGFSAEDRGFRFRGGRACLDLTGTVRRRQPSPGQPSPGQQPDGQPEPGEQLRTPADLARWFVASGLSPQLPAVTRQDLAHARSLRASLCRLITGMLAGQRPGPGDVAIVNDWAGRPAPRPWLEITGGRLRSRQHPATGDTLLAEIARDAVSLLGGPLAGRIRECQGPGCALLFLDASRGGRRRWCSMDTCGARAKMACYRARRGGAAAAGRAGSPAAPRRPPAGGDGT